MKKRTAGWAARLMMSAAIAGAGASALAMDYARTPGISGETGRQVAGRGAAEQERLTNLATQAVYDNPADSAKAIAELRAAGPAGLAAMMATHQAAIDRHRADPTKTDSTWERLSAALDTVAAQKDAWASGIYWYTDLEVAKKVAAASNKPILSLRLLGTLDTDFSCANSRFFRTVLYPNATVGKYLREQFVLHWQSHRPVPRLTIDFGDGRMIERTITGNSVHYVLAPNGRVIDVIPGLYGPGAFVRELQANYGLARSIHLPNFEQLLARAHVERGVAARRAWADDLAAVGAPVAFTSLLSVQTPSGQPPAAAFDLRAANPPADARAIVERANGKVLPPNGGAAVAPPPPAAAAARIAMSKGAIELRPILAMIPDRAALVAGTSEETWAKIAARRAEDAKLDAGSRSVMLAKAGPDAMAANRLTDSKADVETPLVKLVKSFERSVSEDTVRNEYLLHTQAHDWFASGQIPANLDELNERVYAQLFLMPKTDPWLGLVPGDAYTGLPASATVVGGR